MQGCAIQREALSQIPPTNAGDFGRDAGSCFGGCSCLLPGMLQTLRPRLQVARILQIA